MRIFRAIAAVIVGYLVAVVVVAGCFTGLLFALGTEKIYAPGSFWTQDWFNYAGLGVTLVAGVLGGLVCALIGRSSTPVLVLAGLFLVFGLLSAFVNMSKANPEPRIGNVSPMEAASKSKQPNWYAFFVPVLGAGGVIIGGALSGVRARPLP